MKAATMQELMRDRENTQPLQQPLDETVGSVADGGKAIVYRGSYNRERKICRGDIQRCAANNLSIILKSKFPG